MRRTPPGVRKASTSRSRLAWTIRSCGASRSRSSMEVSGIRRSWGSRMVPAPTRTQAVGPDFSWVVHRSTWSSSSSDRERWFRYKLTGMPFVITDPCIGTKDSACVDVCPVDCIHPRKDEPEFATASMLYIHPDECIDCGACVPACPVEAIFALDETPEKWKSFIPVNANYFLK